ncbi:MAG: DUF1289 domain-containing protein [Pseudomonadota bacterium]
MSDEIWRRNEIESPCVKLCVMHPAAGLCVGCFRSGDEIARWSRMDPEERRIIMAALPEREGSIAKRSGGRKARRVRH